MASAGPYNDTSDKKNKYVHTKPHLSVHPPLEFLVIYKTTFLSECRFDWAIGPLFAPPTAKPTRRLLVRLRTFNIQVSRANDQL